MTKPRIALTMGDPAGIGPEIIVGAWSDPAIHEFCRPLVVGHPEILRRAVRLLKSRAQVIQVETPEQSVASADVIPCIKASRNDALEITPGTIDARGGQAAYDALIAATRLALDGRVDALT